MTTKLEAPWVMLVQESNQGGRVRCVNSVRCSVPIKKDQPPVKGIFILVDKILSRTKKG